MTTLTLQKRIIQKIQTHEVLERLLATASSIETELKQGKNFGDEILYRAWIEPKTGLWSTVFETSIGDIYCNELEPNLRKLEIISVHNEEEPCFYTCEVGDFKSLKKLQLELMNDPVVSRIKIDSCENKSAAEVFVFLLRRFRKELLNYQRTFNFLWKHTDLNNALSLSLACK